MLGACGAPAPSTSTSARPAEPAVWQVRAAGGQTPIDPGAAPRALLDAESCRECHAEEHREWSGSRHGQAWTNGIFQREYSAQPRAWCVNCHAPLRTQQEELAAGDSRLADQGVSCAACHVRRGALVSRRRAASSPHETIVDESFGSPAMCADCHQFTFPVMRPRDGVALRMTEHPMQSTVSDFLAGPFAARATGCLTCHATRHGHGFPGGHDPSMLRRALASSWCRAGDAVVIEVANEGAGHRVPTGDIHRHLLARVWRSSAPESTFEAFFGRRYEPAPGGGKRITWDSTLAPGQRRRFRVPLASLASLPPAGLAGEAIAGEAGDEAPELSAGELREAGAPEPAEDGGDPDEPLNFELTYVYTIDEFPRAGRAPGEPVTSRLVAERRAFLDLPRCAE